MEMRIGRDSKWLHPETDQAERVELSEPKESKGEPRGSSTAQSMRLCFLYNVVLLALVSKMGAES